MTGDNQGFNGANGGLVGYELDDQGEWLLVQFPWTQAGKIVVRVSINNAHFITGVEPVADGTLVTPTHDLSDTLSDSHAVDVGGDEFGGGDFGDGDFGDVEDTDEEVSMQK